MGRFMIKVGKSARIHLPCGQAVFPAPFVDTVAECLGCDKSEILVIHHLRTQPRQFAISVGA